MEEKYRLLYFKYLYAILDLDKYEKELEGNGIDCITDEDLMCDEEIVCHRASRYFYLLNEIDLSQLTKEEQEKLARLNVDQLGEEEIAFLRQTCERALVSSEESENVYYGPFMNPRFKAEKKEIALGMKYDEFGFAKEEIKPIEVVNKQREVVNGIIGRIEDGSTSPRVKVIRYNELYKTLNEQGSLGPLRV